MSNPSHLENILLSANSGDTQSFLPESSLAQEAGLQRQKLWDVHWLPIITHPTSNKSIRSHPDNIQARFLQHPIMTPRCWAFSTWVSVAPVWNGTAVVGLVACSQRKKKLNKEPLAGLPRTPSRQSNLTFSWLKVKGAWIYSSVLCYNSISANLNHSNDRVKNYWKTTPQTVNWETTTSHTQITSDAYLIKWAEQARFQETWSILGSLQTLDWNCTWAVIGDILQERENRAEKYAYWEWAS